MATSMTNSARTLALAALLVGVVGLPALADDGLGGRWYENSQSCSNCYDGIDVPYCGDMSPTAMLPCGKWYFQSNILAYQRSATQNEVFQTRNTNTLTSEEVLDVDGNSLGPPRVFTLESSIDRDSVLSTDHLTFQNAAGYRLLLGCRLADNYAMEFSYFDVNDWDETGVVSDATVYDADGTIDPVSGIVTVSSTQPNSLFSPFSNFGDPPIDEFDFNDLATIRYRSSLDNVELNVRHWVTKRPSRLAVSVLWGGRYNAVREGFSYFTSSTVPAADTENFLNISTSNDLWGAQIGAQVDFCWDPGWHTEFEIKGGVAHNRAIMEGFYDIQAAGAPFQGRVEKDVTSFIGELRLTLVYQFGQHLTTHVGYEAVFLSKVALASRNLETDLSILENGPWVIDNSGSVAYHGPSAGFTFAW